MVDRQVRSTEEMDARMAELEAQLAAMTGAKNGEFRSANGRSLLRKADAEELRRKVREHLPARKP